MGTGLTEPFVFVLELGDFSITYQTAGFLEEVKYLISAESELRECMLDALHRAGIEIVSPTFMNQRQLAAERVFIPEIRHATPSKLSSSSTRNRKKIQTAKRASRARARCLR
jgi:small-conductance mechanosensitive channel